MKPRNFIPLLWVTLTNCVCVETSQRTNSNQTLRNITGGSMAEVKTSTEHMDITFADKPTTKMNGMSAKIYHKRTTREFHFAKASATKNCALAPKNKEAVIRVREHIQEGVRLIKYNLQIVEMDRDVPWIKESELYKPFFWVRTVGRHGRSLLLLRNDYSVYSLSTLSIGVKTMDVDLIYTPPNCSYSFSAHKLEELIRELVMNDFVNTSTDLIMDIGEKGSVCNMHVANDTGRADFYYTCCDKGADNKIRCSRLKGDFWLNLLFIVVSWLKVLTFLYSPRLIPGTWYRLKYTTTPYIHELTDSPSVMNISLTNSPEKYTNAKTIFKLSALRHMAKLQSKLKTMVPDVVYTASIKSVCMLIKTGHLLPADYAPVGLVKVLHDSFVKCKIREWPSLKPCCYSDVCGPATPCSRSIPWFRILKELAYGVILLVLAIPWLLRAYVYYTYEHEEAENRRQTAQSLGLKIQFSGSFTLYLTPLHVFFLFIYAILSLESCVYGVLKKRVKKKIKFVLRKCFRDMRERNQMQVVEWAVSLVIKPCSKYGIFGICLFLPLLAFRFPIVFVIVAFYIFPTLNLTFRLMAHFCVYMCPLNMCKRDNECCKKLNFYLTEARKAFKLKTLSSEESLEKDATVMSTILGRCQQLVVITLCLISMYSVIFLLTELISFFVEIFIYTLMGVILNASATLTYVSLVVMLVVYAGDCFGGVPKKFIAFNGAMNNYILSLGKQKVQDVIHTAEDNTNFAFRVKMDQQESQTPLELVKDCEGHPSLRTTRLILFIRKNMPLIPSQFFFDACKMPFFACPGKPMVSYLVALMRFGVSFVFLIFVLIVVLAFGDSYKMSATNQLLATVAGGFLPLILKTFLFKSQKLPAIDTESLNFKVTFDQLLDKYTQIWPAFDILLKEPILVADDTVGEHALLQRLDDYEKPLSEEENKPFLDADPAAKRIIGKINTRVDLLVDVRGVDSKHFQGMQPSMDDERGRGNTGHMLV